MSSPDLSIFREQALKKYLQKQERSILLRLRHPSMLLCLWVLLFLIIGAAASIWSIQIPTYVTGTGLVIEQEQSNTNEAVVLFSLPAGQQADLHKGQVITLTTESAGNKIDGSITSVAATFIDPTQARTRFRLHGALASMLTTPSRMLTVSLKTSAHIHIAQPCSVSIQTGVQNVFSILPGLDQVFKS